MSDTQTETVILSSAANRWEPGCGDATESLGKLLVDERRELPDRATFDGIVRSSLAVLNECKPFDATPGRRTGLVIGYVQSGKTMSMATVTSLARDNGCRIVILLAGVTEILLQQTARKRFRPYLMNQPDARRGWQLRDTVEAPEIPNLKHDLTSWVKEWRRQDVPEARKRPLFIAVMKQHVHLSKLCDILQAVDLRDVPALILDDEADQASLDNNASKSVADASTTYDRIDAIRAALPNHTYLQYTATPQAPLLISLADMLSPDFAHILQPGSGYTGGKTFFVERPDLVAEVKSEDLFDPKAPPDAPPESLLKAMREFFIGAAVGYLKSAKGKRSMLVHPSQNRTDHDAFHSFVQRNKSSWHEELRSDDPSIRAAIAADFRIAYDEIQKTESDLPSFNEVLDELPYLLQDTRLWKVNSDDGREVDWDASYSHMLVGGDKLNRGFTVEGLSVTYMPRKPGSWNADTIQQRARFFGYKRGYLGLCRVYLHPDVRDAYQEYVDHEEDLRTQLAAFAGKPLKEWKRQFLLDHRMKPTRTSILSETISKPQLEGWFRQSWPHADRDAATRNQQRINELLRAAGQAGNTFASVDARARHTSATMSLDLVFDKLLIDYELFGPDAINWTGVLIWVSELRKRRPGATCCVVHVNGGEERSRSEESGTQGKIAQLFEGRRDKSGEGGDNVLRETDLLTVQVHQLAITREKVVMANAPAIAVHFPNDFKPQDTMFQKKAGQVS
jgi:hypothetical protein